MISFFYTQNANRRKVTRFSLMMAIKKNLKMPFLTLRQMINYAALRRSNVIWKKKNQWIAY